MKINHFLFLLFLLFACSVKAQQQQLIPVQQNGRWGFINTDGEVIIPMIYRKAQPFNDGFALVMKEDRYEYINIYGGSVFSQLYDEAYDFYNGRAIVKNDKHFQIIDTLGKELYKLKADKVILDRNIAHFYNLKNIDVYYSKRTNIRQFDIKELKLSRIEDKHHYQKMYFDSYKLENGYLGIIRYEKRTRKYQFIIENAEGHIVKKMTLAKRNSFIKSFNFFPRNKYFCLQPYNVYTNGDIPNPPKFINLYDSLGNHILNYEDPSPLPNKKTNDKYIVSNNRLFTGVNGSHYIYTDFSGNIIRDSILYFCRKYLHENPNELILIREMDGSYALMDWDGNIMKRLQKRLDYIGFDNVNQLLFYTGYYSWQKGVGIANLDGNIILEPKGVDADVNHYHKNIICIKGIDSSWILNGEKIIWSFANSRKERDTLFGSKLFEKELYLDYNMDRNSKEEYNKYLSIYIDTSVKTFNKDSILSFPIKIKSKGLKRNYRRDIDYYIEDYVEIKDKNGNWKKIAYSVISNYNEDNLLGIENKTYTSSLPIYKGSFKTQMRIVFLVRKVNFTSLSLNDRLIKRIYSNSIPIGINPATLFEE